MHVAILNVFFAPHTYGGATVVAEEVGRRLAAEHGLQVSAISVMCRDDLAPYAVVRGEIDGMATWLINLPTGRGYVEGYRNPAVSEQIARILHEIEPDIAHVHCIQDVGADCLLQLKSQGIPTILSVHDFWWICERQFMLRPDGQYCGQSPVRIEKCRGCVDDIGRARTRFASLQSIADTVDIVTYPSRFAHVLCEGSGLAPGKGVVWENGVRLPDRAFFDAQAARRAMDPTLTFGFVGGPSRIKGWPVIHEAFADLEQDNLKGIVVDGSLDGSWWRDRPLDRMAGNWSVHPRYSQNDMDDFFAKIDVLLFLSQWKETFGLTIREAIARGIRVIQTDSGGTIEHAAADPENFMKIGEGPKVLRRHVRQALDAPLAHPNPFPVTSQADQADAFLRIAERVLSGGKAPTGWSARPAA